MAETSLLVALVTGLLASLGHCLGMCGSLVAAYSLSRKPSNGRGIAGQIPSQLALNSGRVITYAVLGAAMGTAGSLLDLMGNAAGLQGVLSIVAGLVMLYVGLSLAGLLPSGEVAPTALFRSLGVSRHMKRFLSSQSLPGNFALGLLWGLLPCGLVFAMLMNAVSTGSALWGALVMVVFGLGTWPALIGFSLASMKIAAHFRRRMMQIAAWPVLILAVQSILRGLAAAGLIPSLIIGGVMLW
jgi:uncharacterized protein